jgi:hypothetical protein
MIRTVNQSLNDTTAGNPQKMQKNYFLNYSDTTVGMYYDIFLNF